LSLLYLEGASPLRGNVSAARLSKPDGTMECRQYKPGLCAAAVWIDASPRTMGASSPADVGAMYEQRYREYVTIFYGGPVPADWIASAPGA
jgi:hypothetical protein